MRALVKPCILISAFHKDKPNTESDIDHVALGISLNSHNYPICEASGKFTYADGRTMLEDCYIVSLDAWATESRDIAQLSAIAAEFGQESILYLDEDRNATLILVETGERVPLGWMKACTLAEAEKAKGYTLVSGIYHTITDEQRYYGINVKIDRGCSHE
jgi:hypothetical protein